MSRIQLYTWLTLHQWFVLTKSTPFTEINQANCYMNHFFKKSFLKIYWSKSTRQTSLTYYFDFELMMWHVCNL